MSQTSWPIAFGFRLLNFGNFQFHSLSELTELLGILEGIDKGEYIERVRERPFGRIPCRVGIGIWNFEVHLLDSKDFGDQNFF